VPWQGFDVQMLLTLILMLMLMLMWMLMLKMLLIKSDKGYSVLTIVDVVVVVQDGVGEDDDGVLWI
jgi:hypothetical protein